MNSIIKNRSGCLRCDVANVLRNVCLQFNWIWNWATIHHILKITPQPEVIKVEVWWTWRPGFRTITADKSIISKCLLSSCMSGFAICGGAPFCMKTVLSRHARFWNVRILWLYKLFTIHGTGLDSQDQSPRKKRSYHTQCHEPLPHSHLWQMHRYWCSCE